MLLDDKKEKRKKDRNVAYPFIGYLIPDLTADWMACINILILYRSRFRKLSATEKDFGGIWVDGEEIVGKVPGEIRLRFFSLPLLIAMLSSAEIKETREWHAIHLAPQLDSQYRLWPTGICFFFLCILLLVVCELYPHPR